MIVDTRGMQCPKPIIETKKALRDLTEKGVISVLIDNETSLGNVSKFLKDTGCTFTQAREGDHWVMTITAHDAVLKEIPADEYCGVPDHRVPSGNYVVSLTSDIMGQGDDILGRRLMTSFVNILTELDSLPSAIVCYNSGVKLALQGSSTVETLKELELRGVEIILCGTCIDFFELKGKTDAGTIGDMYKIAGMLAAAGSIIKP
jgi:selenium metabolism protein YedF